jgi:predicted metal-dependent phosphoesterase TrpH
MSIDLHIHSTISDGTMSPVELVKYARKKGLSAIAITDHDTVGGVEEAIAAGNSLGVEVIPGIELSVRFADSTVHLLGYLFDCRQVELHAALGRLQDGRLERNKNIIARLNRLGIGVDFSELEKISGPGQCGRPHIAKLLVDKNVVKTMDEAFKVYLGQGGLAYASRFVYGAQEAINLINNAGGVAILAHPLKLGKSEKEFSFTLNELIGMGLNGIEAYYPTHSRKYRRELLRFAEKHSLVTTGGSDFHGSIRPGTTLAGGKNVSVPSGVLIKMKECVAEIRNQKKLTQLSY